MAVGVVALLDAAGSVILPLLGQELLYSTILCLVIVAAARMIKTWSPYWHLGLWMMLLIRLVLPPNLSSPVSGRMAFDYLFATQFYQQVAASFHHVSRATFIAADGERFSGETSGVMGTLAYWRKSSSSEQTIPYAGAALLLWGCGAALCAAAYLRQWLKYRRYIRQASPVIQVELLRLTEEFRSRFGLRRSIRLVTSDRSLTPFTFGVWRPAIYLPESLIRLQAQESISAVIAHEIAHIKRGDALWIILQHLLHCVYFFHPVVWFANRRIHEAREQICDQLAIATCRMSPSSYGYSLLFVVKLNLFGDEGMKLLPAFNSQYKTIRDRIQSLQHGTTLSKRRGRLVYALLLCAAIFLLPMAQEVSSLTTGFLSSPFMNEQRTSFQAFQQRIIASYGIWTDEMLPFRHRHAGIDLRAMPDEPVYAVSPGEVVRVSYQTPRTIIVKHDPPQHEPFYAVYGNIKDVQVSAGERVEAMTQLGQVAALPDYVHVKGIAGAFLHLEIRHSILDGLAASFNSKTTAQLDQYCYNPVKFFQDAAR
ncbi:hypothetical protein U14_03097 [Candidatus Moduliflexus flocculans]|uniref:Peptidase M56 domain-containing protein n=1 Tax=Candidatus Moduliflexus flocculans TaxID=1499966 RepID=A0A081BN85_9BACT|nr:hypothetical protein U14_03097 [Candidatus Moduliflexus flocculans]